MYEKIFLLCMAQKQEKATMRRHSIALAQINPTVGDIKGNVEKIISAAEQAKASGASIVVFPEQVVTGYPAQDLLLHDDFVSDTERANVYLQQNIQGITAILGTIERTKRGPRGKSLLNTALVLRDGDILGKQAKTHLPTEDVFHEARYFTPATLNRPIVIDGVKYGIQICEDMWDEQYETKVTKELVAHGAEVIINLSASPFHIDKLHLRRNIIERHVAEQHVPFLYVNMVGGQDELVFDGGSLAYTATGRLAAQFPQFKEQIGLVDLAKILGQTPEPLKTEEQIFHATVLGVKDYFRKKKKKKAVLGLSGGIDSTVTALIAAEALGPENVFGIALPSAFNPESSKNDAHEFARRLGIDFAVIPIGSMYNQVMEELQSTFGGKPFDVTEENIQARLRTVVLMAEVNKHGYAMLTTGDKSEIAIGYYTLYGDGGGSLGVISDLTKPEVYQLARWYNTYRGEDIVPRSILEKVPSPELKPGQVAPYPYDTRSKLLEMMTARKTVQEMTAAGYSLDDVRDAFKKFRTAEFKRKQAPLLLKLKPVSFGEGRMYPVSNAYVPSDLLLSY